MQCLQLNTIENKENFQTNSINNSLQEKREQQQKLKRNQIIEENRYQNIQKLQNKQNQSQKQIMSLQIEMDQLPQQNQQLKNFNPLSDLQILNNEIESVHEILNLNQNKNQDFELNQYDFLQESKTNLKSQKSKQARESLAKIRELIFHKPLLFKQCNNIYKYIEVLQNLLKSNESCNPLFTMDLRFQAIWCVSMISSSQQNSYFFPYLLESVLIYLQDQLNNVNQQQSAINIEKAILSLGNFILDNSQLKEQILLQNWIYKSLLKICFYKQKSVVATSLWAIQCIIRDIPLIYLIQFFNDPNININKVAISLLKQFNQSFAIMNELAMCFAQLSMFEYDNRFQIDEKIILEMLCMIDSNKYISIKIILPIITFIANIIQACSQEFIIQNLIMQGSSNGFFNLILNALNNQQKIVQREILFLLSNLFLYHSDIFIYFIQNVLLVKNRLFEIIFQQDYFLMVEILHILLSIIAGEGRNAILFIQIYELKQIYEKISQINQNFQNCYQYLEEGTYDEKIKKLSQQFIMQLENKLNLNNNK